MQKEFKYAMRNALLSLDVPQDVWQRKFVMYRSKLTSAKFILVLHKYKFAEQQNCLPNRVAFVQHVLKQANKTQKAMHSVEESETEVEFEADPEEHTENEADPEEDTILEVYASIFSAALSSIHQQPERTQMDFLRLFVETDASQKFAQAMQSAGER